FREFRQDIQDRGNRLLAFKDARRFKNFSSSMCIIVFIVRCVMPAPGMSQMVNPDTGGSLHQIALRIVDGAAPRPSRESQEYLLNQVVYCALISTAAAKI